MQGPGGSGPFSVGARQMVVGVQADTKLSRSTTELAYAMAEPQPWLPASGASSASSSGHRATRAIRRGTRSFRGASEPVQLLAGYATLTRLECAVKIWRAMCGGNKLAPNNATISAAGAAALPHGDEQATKCCADFPFSRAGRCGRCGRRSSLINPGVVSLFCSSYLSASLNRRIFRRLYTKSTPAQAFLFRSGAASPHGGRGRPPQRAHG